MKRSNPSGEKGNSGRWLWKLHHWSGLYSGILIGILSLTGALAVFIPEIDQLIKRGHYKVLSSREPGALPAFSESLSDLTLRYPDYRSVLIELPSRPGEVAEIKLGVPSEEGVQTLAFFVDDGRDTVLDSRIHQNSLANYLRQIHVRLYEGNWGRQLVGLGGIAFFVLILTGLLIYGNFMKRQVWPAVRQGRGLRILMADWHKILGIGALAFNLVIALTGAWLGLQPQLMKWFDISVPNRFKAPVIMEDSLDRALAVNWEEAWKAVKREFPEFVPRQVVPSVNGSASLLFRGDIPGTVYERQINTLVLSKQGLEPLFRYDVREQPFGHRFFFVQEALHFGDFGGLALKILYALLGLVSAFLSISGFVVYLCRTGKKLKRSASPLKLVFVYSLGIVLLLTILALLSCLVGYGRAAFLAALLVNGILGGFLLYALGRFLLKAWKLPGKLTEKSAA